MGHDLKIVKQAATGNWERILLHFGFPGEYLRNTGWKCPRCGDDGKGNAANRFRMFNDWKETGGSLCNKCNPHKSADGFSTLQWFLNKPLEEVVDGVGEYLNCQKPARKGNTSTSPATTTEVKDSFETRLNLQPLKLEIATWWAMKKGGFTAEAVFRIGARAARINNRACIAIPIWGEKRCSAPAVGYILYALNGDPLPVYEKGNPNPVDHVKSKLAFGSKPGVICELTPNQEGRNTLAIDLPTVDTLVKTEGATDLLAFLSQSPERNVAAFTTGCGCSENPAHLPWLVALAKDRNCYTVHDCDKPGQAGATYIESNNRKRAGWAPFLATVAKSSFNVVLPFDMSEDHGKDLRDYFQSATLADFWKLARSSTLYAAPSDDATASTKEDLALISNYTLEYQEGKQPKVWPTKIGDIIKQLKEVTGDWPRRVGSSLFVHENDRIDYLPNTSALFGWIQSKCGLVPWKREAGCVAKDELFFELCRTATSYAAIETQPHFPPIKDAYYTCEIPPASEDVSALEKLVEYFCPAEDVDACLIMSLFVTPFWGCEPGNRPAFLITADAGRGVGKSKLSEMLARLCGGAIDIDPTDDSYRVRVRLLSPEGAGKRVARLDNVKTLRFSCGDLESLITTATISGHKLHTGESIRPNNLTWVITLNGASLSTDMAQRVIPVKLRPPTRKGDWERQVSTYIDENRQAILSAIHRFLTLPTNRMSQHTRWPVFEDQIISRFESPDEIQAIYRSRQNDFDVEQEEFENLEEFFEQRLRNANYQTGEKIHIPSQIATHWFNTCQNDKKTTASASRILTQFCKEKQNSKLQINPTRKYGRGFVFCLEDEIPKEKASLVGAYIMYDLESRLLKY